MVTITAQGIEFPGSVSVALLHPNQADLDIERVMNDAPVPLGRSMGFSSLVKLEHVLAAGYVAPHDQGTLTVGIVSRKVMSS